jgi:hypothetical protein
MPNTTKDAAVALPDWPDTDPSNGEIARDNVAHQPVSAPSPEVEPKAQDDTADDADDVERLSPNSSPPSYSKTTEPVADSTAENDGAEGGDAGTETDGVEDDGGAGDDDDDLDFEPWDELDDAAAQHKEDWRRATQPRSEPVDGEELFAARVEVLPPLYDLTAWCCRSAGLVGRFDLRAPRLQHALCCTGDDYRAGGE